MNACCECHAAGRWQSGSLGSSNCTPIANCYRVEEGQERLNRQTTDNGQDRASTVLRSRLATCDLGLSSSRIETRKWSTASRNYRTTHVEFACCEGKGNVKEIEMLCHPRRGISVRLYNAHSLLRTATRKYAGCAFVGNLCTKLDNLCHQAPVENSFFDKQLLGCVHFLLDKS